MEPEELALRLWRQLYQTYTLLKQCENRIFEQYGLTTEQYAVLVSISHLGQPARITDIAHWLGRSTNSVSMIVDRTAKVGLVRRARDKGDRGAVLVSKTSKAESLFRPATVASFASVLNILPPMPYENRHALLNLLRTVKYETLKCLDPETDIEKVKKHESKQAAFIKKKWISEYKPSSALQAGCHVARRTTGRKTGGSGHKQCAVTASQV